MCTGHINIAVAVAASDSVSGEDYHTVSATEENTHIQHYQYHNEGVCLRLLLIVDYWETVVFIFSSI